MPRLVISTVGTSLLTNQIRERRDPKGWEDMLKKTANLTHEQISQSYPEVLDIINELKLRSEEKLNDGNTIEIRDASAELNGIYGLYKEQLSQGSKDIHWLIASNTAQDEVTAEMLQEFLHKRGLTVDIYTPKGLSASNTEVFTNGIDELLNWIDDTVPGYKESGYQICFNLVGGFKAIQGFANTIGMFYADEIIYIFEGSRDIIKIPRLPIQVDKSAINPVQFALMAAGEWVAVSDLNNVPETLIFKVDDTATLTNWGRLIWNRSKEDLLSGELLQFPQLMYEPSFRRDYDSITDKQEKVKLQETLAKVSHLLMKHNGNTAPLKSDGGVKYEVYERTERNQIEGLAHFRVTQALRVSCITSGNVLILRHYGLNLHSPRNA